MTEGVAATSPPVHGKKVTAVHTDQHTRQSAATEAAVRDSRQ